MYEPAISRSRPTVPAAALLALTIAGGDVATARAEGKTDRSAAAYRFRVKRAT